MSVRALLFVALAAAPAAAQAPIPYGPPVDLATARKKVIGAVGVSGVKANEDAQAAQAGLDALKGK